MSPEAETVSSQRTLGRLRVFPVDSSHWLVVGAKRDLEVTAESFFQLLNAVRDARRASR